MNTWFAAETTRFSLTSSLPSSCPCWKKAFATNFFASSRSSSVGGSSLRRHASKPHCRCVGGCLNEERRSACGYSVWLSHDTRARLSTHLTRVVASALLSQPGVMRGTAMACEVG